MMNRVIKFRQFIGGAFVFWGIFNDPDGAYFHGPASQKGEHAGNTINDQFTGLYDRNGREIFGGDILKWKCSKSGSIKVKDYIVTIDWPDRENANGWLLTIHDNGEKWGTGTSYWKKCDRVVIGNIHQNGDLLK